MPITVNSGNTARTNLVVRQDINMAHVFKKLGLQFEVDRNSFRLLEYSDRNALDFNASIAGVNTVDYLTSYNSSTKILTLTFRLAGTTNPFSSRLFMLYFDSNQFSKALGTEQSLSYSQPSPLPLIVIGDPEKLSGIHKTIRTARVDFFNPNSMRLDIFNRKYEERLALNNGLDSNCSVDFNVRAYVSCQFPALLKIRLRNKDANREFLDSPVKIISPLKEMRVATPSGISNAAAGEFYFSYVSSGRSLTNADFTQYDVVASRSASLLLMSKDGNLEKGRLLVRVPRKS